MFATPLPGLHPSEDPIRLADWVELNLLLDEEATVSVTNITDELSDTPPDDAASSERRFSGEDHESPGYWESAEAMAETALSELVSRATWLGDRYPLAINGDAAALSEVIARRDTYRFLVALRARHLYADGLGDDGATSGLIFEELSKHALGSYLGADHEHRVRFGTAGGHRGDGLPDDLSGAVRELRQRLHEAPGQIPDRGRDDYRADVVAWKPFGDDRPGQLVAVGQATISEREWLKKEPASRWTDRKPATERLVNFLARPVTIVAFAETLSLTRQDTLAGLASSFSSIPFDRLRLLSVLQDSEVPESLRLQMNQWAETIRDRLLA